MKVEQVETSLFNCERTLLFRGHAKRFDRVNSEWFDNGGESVAHSLMVPSLGHSSESDKGQSRAMANPFYRGPASMTG
jgi:hypothetical protein